jgi:hypothetical protein
MPAKKHHVTLTQEQRERVEIVARSYKHSERERTHARILLLADAHAPEGAAKDDTIAAQVSVCLLTVQQVRRRFAEGGLEVALFRKEPSNRKVRLLDGAAEAFLVATTCSAPPERRSCQAVLGNDHTRVAPCPICVGPQRMSPTVQTLDCHYVFPEFSNNLNVSTHAWYIS